MIKNLFIPIVSSLFFRWCLRLGRSFLERKKYFQPANVASRKSCPQSYNSITILSSYNFIVEEVENQKESCITWNFYIKSINISSNCRKCSLINTMVTFFKAYHTWPQNKLRVSNYNLDHSKKHFELYFNSFKFEISMVWFEIDFHTLLNV